MTKSIAEQHRVRPSCIGSEPFRIKITLKIYVSVYREEMCCYKWLKPNVFVYKKAYSQFNN